jgi:hypothetical protein
MKRRRQKLQVSTFPFLAVLLSAMGSLILVLLAVDQKARAAARAKAQREAAQVVEQAEREATERRAEWERKRQEVQAAWEQKRDDLHDQLTAEERALQARMSRLREELADAADRLRAERDETGQLRRRLEVERGLLEGAEKSLARSRAAGEEAASQSEATRAWLARMTKDVEQLERALADLKAARERDRQTYSVIPYRGRNGESRRPLYVECAGGKLIFHPDRFVVSESSPAADVRAEVQRRTARQKEQLPAADQNSFQPYLMVLVRPDGVASYYHLQGALHGLDAEFGYEFIDADWLLDFPDDGGPAKSQPWLAGTKPGDPAPPAGGTPAGTPLKGVRLGQGMGPVVERGSGGAATGNKPGAAGSGSLPPGANPFGVPGTLVSGTGVNRTGEKSSHGIAEILPPSLANLEGGTGTSSKGPGHGSTGLLPRPSPANGTGNSPSATAGVGSAGSPPAATPPSGTDVSPGSKVGARADGAALPRPSESGSFTPSVGAAGPGGFSADGATPGLPMKTTGGKGSPPTPGVPTAGAEVRSNGTESAPASSGSGGGSSEAPSTQGTGSPGAQQPPGGAAGNPQPPGGKASSTNSRAGTQEEGSSSAGSAGDAVGRFAPGVSSERERRPPPMRAVNLSGDRDWVIYVECTAEGVVLYPARTFIPLAALSRGPANPLQQAVQQMIDRRQSGVRPGEAPYRPQVRFLVRPENMRVFHVAYPALDAVPAAKARYTLRPEDDVLAIVTGH